MMELVQEDIIMNGNLEGGDKEASEVTSLRERSFPRSHFPSAAWKWAYIFDRNRNYYRDRTEGRGKEFCWYHIELPKGNQKLSQSAQYLIDLLCPPLKLQDILSLVSNASFCGYVDGALVFRVNSPGPASSAYISRLAARITENSVITVSWVLSHVLGSLRWVSPYCQRSQLTRLLDTVMGNKGKEVDS